MKHLPFSQKMSEVKYFYAGGSDYDIFMFVFDKKYFDIYL